MRDKSFDGLKCILMYFVVLQHTLYFLNGWGYYTSGLPQQNLIGEYLRCIQMPAFMIVSGFFFKKSAFRSPRFIDLFVNNILLGTIVPLISWGVFAYLIENSGNYSWRAFLEFFWVKFWFFKVLVFLKVVFSIDHYFTVKNVFIALLVVVLMIVPASKDNNFLQFSAMFPFFLIGYTISETKYEQLVIKNRIDSKRLFLYSFIWLGMFIFAKKHWGIYDQPLRCKNVADLVKLGYSIFIKTIGTYLLYEQVKKYSDKIKLNWGGYTIAVYPLHCIIVDLLSGRNVFEYVSCQSQVYISIRSILIAGMIFVTCNIIVNYIAKSKVLSFLFLGKNKAKKKGKNNNYA